MPIDLSKMIIAVGALGTASYGLVDATKAFGGGISKAGFVYIQRTVVGLLRHNGATGDRETLLGTNAILAELKANWLNGIALADQRSIAKSLIKLRLNPENAATFAEKTGVAPKVLTSVAGKISTGEALTAEEADAFGRFDLILTSALDEAYQRGDQRYRNWCKLLAIPMSVVLAVLGGWTIQPTNYIHSAILGQSLLAGLLATPLAPVAKDLSSAVQAATKAVQSLKG